MSFVLKEYSALVFVNNYIFIRICCLVRYLAYFITEYFCKLNNVFKIMYNLKICYFEI